ncbi:MAG: dicarboxylate/amino acid:cation symporter [Planctomycetota bacterium]
MKFHWKVLLWMFAGVVLGLVAPRVLTGGAYAGLEFAAVDGALEVTSVDPSGPAAPNKSGLVKGKPEVGDRVVGVWRNKGTEREQRFDLAAPEDVDRIVGESSYGDVLRFETPTGELRMVGLVMQPDSWLQRVIWPFDFLGDIFLALLKMLIVPLVFSSIVTGVAGVGNMRDLRRMGGKTFLYYISTSLLAIVVGQVLVSTIRPGDGAELGLSGLEEGAAPEAKFHEILLRMVPPNVFEAMGDNGKMLSVIFFALMFGFFITRAVEPHSTRMRELFDSAFQVMMRMAEGVLSLLPYGVFCLMVRVVAKTGFSVFEPLLLYMLTVALALLFHAGVTLPMIVRVLGRTSPLRWFKAMSPALMTAFSTSSSSMTLPVTMETVEKRGRVSNKVTSFTLPLGATINMDGTALYECIGVIFLAQYYAGVSGFELTFAAQAMVVLMALLASIGAAGIPSAGLVMMLTILAALGLPLEGAALLLAVDRPLDMMRTVVNVWSDSCGACVIARSEGEEGPLQAGSPAG